MTHLRLPVAVLTAALAAAPAHAEVKKFMNRCNAGLCAYYRLVLTPPDGWVVDKQATEKRNVQIMVPKGTNFANAPLLIYVQVFYHDKKQTLADFASVSNGRWKAHVEDAKISELPAVARANGKPGYLRFSFENPSKSRQPYELGAFGVDTDEDGNEFVLDVVMTGGDKAALDRADGAYIAFLKAN
ncbi:MAG: hypothetical protein ACRECL_07425 [Bradyrhizobium sp.]